MLLRRKKIHRYTIQLSTMLAYVNAVRINDIMSVKLLRTEVIVGWFRAFPNQIFIMVWIFYDY